MYKTLTSLAYGTKGNSQTEKSKTKTKKAHIVAYKCHQNT